MDYKKIIRSQRFRFFILKILLWVPDRIMLSVQYRIKLGRWPNIKNPQRFTEKLQVYKMLYRNKVLHQCVDKYEVRKYVESKGLSNILTQLYGIYDDASKIVFSSLPHKFVIKTTDGGGGECVLICKDVSVLNVEETIVKVNSWLNRKEINAGREWAYTGIKKSRIIIEEYLENEDNPEAGISDYKFFCFKGEPYCVVYDIDRYIGHKRNFYDINWQSLNVSSDCPPFQNDVLKPTGFDRMLEIAKQLSADFPFVRVDLYYVKNQVYLGELTFYPWSGYVQYDPDSFDFDLGRQFDITSFTK